MQNIYFFFSITDEALTGTRVLKGDVLALQIKKPDWFKVSVLNILMHIIHY